MCTVYYLAVVHTGHLYYNLTHTLWSQLYFHHPRHKHWTLLIFRWQSVLILVFHAEFLLYGLNACQTKSHSVELLSMNWFSSDSDKIALLWAADVTCCCIRCLGLGLPQLTVIDGVWLRPVPNCAHWRYSALVWYYWKPSFCILHAALLFLPII